MLWQQQNNGYLPVTRSSSRNSSSGSISFSIDKSYSESIPNDSPIYTIHRLAALAAPTNWTALWRRRLLVLLHLASLAFGIYGVLTLAGIKSGKLMYTPIYSKYDIAQAGYNRKDVTPPKPTIHDISEGDRLGHSTKPSEIHDIQKNHKTILDSWTFPSTSTINPVSSSSSSIEQPNDQHLLILSPIRNAHGILPTYFEHLENLQHPKENTSIGFLLSDEEDETGILVQHWCDEQAAKGEYRHITLLRKDFGLFVPKGQARHENWIQAQRRALMARARTLLLISTVNAAVDWVFWLDVDVKEMPSTIIQDLMHFGRVKEENNDMHVIADIITPNIMDRVRDTTEIHPYDRNNWAETPKSLKMKATLGPDVIVHEGDQDLPTYRQHLAQWVAPNVTLDPFLPELPQAHDTLSSEEPSDLYDPESKAYIGRQIPLDAVGGVATLVRASVHLFGGVFPSWNVDHAVETEGFGVLAKLVGARVIGLPNYLVIHR